MDFNWGWGLSDKHNTEASFPLTRCGKMKMLRTALVTGGASLSPRGYGCLTEAMLTDDVAWSHLWPRHPDKHRYNTVSFNSTNKRL